MAVGTTAAEPARHDHAAQPVPVAVGTARAGRIDDVADGLGEEGLVGSYAGARGAEGGCGRPSWPEGR
jgi:hypothetical protein